MKYINQSHSKYLLKATSGIHVYARIFFLPEIYGLDNNMENTNSANKSS